MGFSQLQKLLLNPVHRLLFVKTVNDSGLQIHIFHVIDAVKDSKSVVNMFRNLGSRSLGFIISFF